VGQALPPGASACQLPRRRQCIPKSWCRGAPVLQHVTLHRLLQPAHPQRAGFLESPPVLPAIVRNAVARQHHAGPVGAPPAMDEHRAGRAVIEHGEQPRNHGVRRRRDAAQRNAHVVHAVSLYQLLLRPRTAARLSQVDHGFDTQLREAVKALHSRLAPAINVLVDLLEFANSGNVRAPPR